MKKFRKTSPWEKRKRKKLEAERIRQRDLQRERLVAEAQQVALRERDTKSESTVWFSRLVHDGWPRHLALVTAGAKYELWKISDDKQGKYAYKMTQPWSIGLEEFDASNSQSSINKPSVDGYHMAHIGSTFMTPAQIDQACEAIVSGFETSEFGWKDCQEFLKQFMNRVLVTAKTKDTAWFIEYTQVEQFETDVAFILPPDDFVAAVVARRADEQRKVAAAASTSKTSYISGSTSGASGSFGHGYSGFSHISTSSASHGFGDSGMSSSDFGGGGCSSSSW
jgi:hypothetical protein